MEFVDLASYIDTTKTECLNEEDGHLFSHAMAGMESMSLRSDCDEQLVINIYFTQPVKLHYVSITPSPNVDHYPSDVDFFVNKAPLDFDDVESIEPTNNFKLTDPGEEMKLDFVKYQSVSSLTVNISQNMGEEDQTEMGRLNLYGLPTKAVDVGKLGQQEETKKMEPVKPKGKVSRPRPKKG